MTPAEAYIIAAEQAAFWQRDGLTAAQAWWELAGQRRRYVTWKECVGWMMRWQMRQAAPQPAPFKKGPAPRSYRLAV